MQSLLGSYVHPFSHFKAAMSNFGRVFRWVSRLPEKGIAKIPWSIKQELFAAALHLPFAFSDLRSPVSTNVYYSDATPSTGGYVWGKVSRAFSEALHDMCDTRGRHARLDWTDKDVQALGWEDKDLGDRRKETL